MRPDSETVLNRLSAGLLAVLLVGCSTGQQESVDRPDQTPLAGSQLEQLLDISIEALRVRTYGEGNLKVIAPIERHCTTSDASGARENNATRSLAAYESEGLRIYTRIDVPNTQQPETGYPVMIFAHGWVGSETAPDWHFGCTTESIYGDIYGDVINAWVDAGFLVLVPGYRGHGTVDGVPADGHDDMLAWDNGSYLMPSFYAVDVMNVMAASTHPGGVEVPSADGNQRTVQVDRSRMFINGHSQGGDVALTVLAAVGEGAASGLELTGTSIWAGNIADRFTQLATFEAMSTSPDAFLSGDGAWTGSALGSDGSHNPDFIFGFPPDWIGTPDPEEWTWQNETFSRNSVAEALRAKAEIMYDTLNTQVREYGDLTWDMVEEPDGRAVIAHDPRLIAPMTQIGGAGATSFITEPLHLHYSDRDFYSLPIWNEELCAALNTSGGECRTFEYVGNTHSLGLSEHGWFSPPGSVAGHARFIQNDLCAFASAGVSEGSNCQGSENR